MFTNIKYSILTTLRNKEHFFSTLFLPIFMVTVMSFVNNVQVDHILSENFTIPVGIVSEGENMFTETLGGLIEFQVFNEIDEALYELYAQNLDGVFHVNDTVNLFVINGGFNQLILQMIADEYAQTRELSILNRVPVLTSMDIQNTVLDQNIMMAFFMLAMIGLLGAFQGFVKVARLDGDTPLGSRLLVSKMEKSKIVISDLIAISILQTIFTFIMWAYLIFVLDINLSFPIHLTTAAILVGSFLGAVFGTFIGIVLPFSKKTKEKIIELTLMGFGFAAGLFTFIRNVEIINLIQRFNPFVIFTDALLSLHLNIFSRYIQSISTLFIVSVVLFIITLIFLRRYGNGDSK